jgi:hypothetical protein
LQPGQGKLQTGDLFQIQFALLPAERLLVDRLAPVQIEQRGPLHARALAAQARDLVGDAARVRRFEQLEQTLVARAQLGGELARELVAVGDQRLQPIARCARQAGAGHPSFLAARLLARHAQPAHHRSAPTRRARRSRGCSRR